MTEFNSVVKKIEELKRKQRERNKERIELASELKRQKLIVAGGKMRYDRRLRGTNWFGGKRSQSPRYRKALDRILEIEKKRRLIKPNITSYVMRHQFKFVPVKSFPVDSPNLKRFEILSNKKKVKINLVKYYAYLKKYLDPFFKKMKIYEEEIKKYRHWKGLALNDFKKTNPTEYGKYNIYRSDTDKVLAEQKKKVKFKRIP